MMDFKKFFQKYPWQVWLIIVAAVIVQLILFYYKEMIHVDEIFSFGTANGDFGVFFRYHAEEMDNHLFTGDDFRQYLLLQHSSFSDMWAHLKLDVHMPLYFVLLRLLSYLFAPEFTFAPAIILNVFTFIGFLCAMYRLLMTLFKQQETAIVGLMLSAFFMPVLSLSVFMRMYMLWMMLCVFLLDYTLRYIEDEKILKSNCSGIFFFSLLQILTHFYGFIFGFVLCGCVCVDFLFKKRYRHFKFYVGINLLSVVVAYLIFPEMINIGLHSERGLQTIGFFSNLMSLFMIKMPLFINTMFGNFIIALCFLFFLIGGMIAGVYKRVLFVVDKNNIVLLLAVFMMYGVLSCLIQPWMGVWQIRYYTAILPIFILLLIFIFQLWWQIFKLPSRLFIIFLMILSLFVAGYSAFYENPFWCRKNNEYRKFENIIAHNNIWWGLGGAPSWTLHILMNKLIDCRHFFLHTDTKDKYFEEVANNEAENGQYTYYVLPFLQSKVPQGAIEYVKQKTGRQAFYLFGFNDEKYHSFLEASVFLVAPY